MTDVNNGTTDITEAELTAVLMALPKDKLTLIAQFIRQIAMSYDPDIVQDFLNWRADERIETLLQLASKLDSDALDQLLFAAEDLYQENARRDRH